jgi:hypothetical protein
MYPSTRRDFSRRRDRQVDTSGDGFLGLAHNSSPLRPHRAVGRTGSRKLRPGRSNSQPARDRQTSHAHAHHTGRARARHSRRKLGRAPGHRCYIRHHHRHSDKLQTLYKDCVMVTPRPSSQDALRYSHKLGQNQSHHARCGLGERGPKRESHSVALGGRRWAVDGRDRTAAMGPERG